MEKLVKENIAYILIVLIAFIGGIYGIFYFGSLSIENFQAKGDQEQILKTKQERLENIRQQKALAKKAETENKKESKSGKIIYEVLGQQFSSEASFGIMFDNILANMTNSGLRIRSIDYKYSGITNDKIAEANLPDYNVCELSFVTVSDYTQLQTFFKSLAKENYLTNISEIYIEPYDGDKTILISRFKVRLYTKTI